MTASKVTAVIASFTLCYDCQFGEHREPPRWHTWASKEDIEHAKKTGQPDPRFSRCGCWCAREGK